MLFLSPPDGYHHEEPFLFFQWGKENGFQLVVKVDRKMGSRNVFERGPDARRVWQVSLPVLSQALLPVPLGFRSMS